MGFRQHNKLKREQHLAFQEWLKSVQNPLAQSGLPASVTGSRDDWAYFLQFRYHDHGNWNTPPLTMIDFTWDELTLDQQKVVLALEASWNEGLASHPILAERISAQKSL